MARLLFFVCLLAAVSVKGCAGTEQTAGTVRDVAGDLLQHVEQQTGVDSETIAKVILCGGAWIMAFGLIGWLVPNPKKIYIIGFIMALIVLLAFGVPYALFGGW